MFEIAFWLISLFVESNFKSSFIYIYIEVDIKIDSTSHDIINFDFLFYIPDNAELQVREIIWQDIIYAVSKRTFHYMGQ